MPNPIIPKKSAVSSKVPLSANLQVGEIAINLADYVLYSKDSNNNVFLIKADPLYNTGLQTNLDLKANIATPIFTGTVSSPTFISTVTNGTAPFTVSSNTVVLNLNSDFLDGQHGSYYTANSIFASHVANTSNPHQVTATQLGLGNVENITLSTWPGTANITTVGNVTSGTWNSNIGPVSGANLLHLTAGNLEGTIPSTVLGNSTVYIGTTGIPLNRASSIQTLTGVSIDGNANTATNIIGGFVNGTTASFSGVITSTVTNGTAPFTVSSNTVVTNLNADLIDGYHITDLDNRFVNVTGDTITGNLSIIGNVTTNTLQFNTSANNSNIQQGEVYWDSLNRTLDVGLGNGVVGQAFQEVHYPLVKNNTANTILNGTVVGLTGVDSGHTTVAPYSANSAIFPLPQSYMGMATEDIASGSTGLITYFGQINDLNTLAWTPGTILYASDTTPGALTSTPPSAPSNIVIVAIVITQHATQGAVVVKNNLIARADQVPYDPTVSGMTSRNVSGALDELQFNKVDIGTSSTNLVLYPTTTQTDIQLISTTGTVGTITGVGPWTATITGMTSTTGLVVGSYIKATNGTGSLGSGGLYKVLTANTNSLTFSATGGTTPVAGTITNIYKDYFVLVTTTTDPRYNSTANNFQFTPSGTGYLIATRVTDPGIIIGNPGLVSLTYLANIYRVSGNANQYSEFYWTLYKRDVSGNETLLGTSSSTGGITSGSYMQYPMYLTLNDGSYLSTDRFVIRTWANQLGSVGGGTYDSEIGGTNPSRILFPVPANVVPTPPASSVLTDISNFNNFLTSAETNVQAALDRIDNLAASTVSPTFTGIPLAPTAAASANSSQIATTAFVQSNFTLLRNGAPSTLDTLGKIAIAINNDPNYYSTVNTALGTKVDKSTYIIAGTGLTGTSNLSANVTLALATSGVVANTYGSPTNVPVFTVDTYGRITSANTMTISSPITFLGDVTGSGTTSSNTTLTLSNSGVVANTYTKVTVDSKGRVTSGTFLSSSDLPQINTGLQIISSVTNGTSPFSITSTSLNTNLNADLLDGQHGTYYTTAGNLTGTIPSTVLGNSTLYIGTTSIDLNRASGVQTLTGVSIDGNANNSPNLGGQPASYYAPLVSPSFTTPSLGVATAISLQTSGDVIIGGNLTVSGNTTIINAQTLQVFDKNIEIGKVSTPSDSTANGGGITLKGSSDKTIIWDSINSNWTSSEHWNVSTGKVYKINNVEVLNSTGLGSTIVNSSLTSVGTITSGTWSGSFGIVSGANLTNLTAGNLTGTIPSTVLGNSTVYIGTTSIALNRASGVQTLTGISIDGNAVTATSANNSSYLGGNLPSYYTTAGNLTGTIPSAVLGNSTHYIGTTSIALNRASGVQTLTGVSIDGSAGSVSGSNITGTTLASNVINSSLTSVGTLTNLTVTNPISGNITGTASNITGTYGGTLTSLQITSGLGYTPYNSTNPAGYITSSASITGSAGSVAAANITGTTLASNVINSSLVSVGTLTSGSINWSSNITTSGVGYFGPTSPLSLSNPLLVCTSNVNSYNQIQIQNTNTGTFASSDFIATADNGTDSTKFIDFGINNSGFNNPSWTISGANDGYLYINGGNLTLGTDTTGKSVSIHTGGTSSTNIVAKFNAVATTSANTSTGSLVVNGGLGVQGNISANSISVVSGTFTGFVSAPTATSGTANTQVATTEFVENRGLSAESMALAFAIALG